jgi:hypothetical protein
LYGEKSDLWLTKKTASYHPQCARRVYGHCDLYRLFPRARERGEITTIDEYSIRRFQDAVCSICHQSIWLPEGEIAARLTITIADGASLNDRWRLRQFPWVKPEPFEGVFFTARLPLPLMPAVERLPFIEAIRYGRPEDILMSHRYWYPAQRVG